MKNNSSFFFVHDYVGQLSLYVGSYSEWIAIFDQEICFVLYIRM